MTGQRSAQLLAAMEAARQAERVGLELYEQGVTEQDVHIIYGELQALRELQSKRGARLQQSFSIARSLYDSHVYDVLCCSRLGMQSTTPACGIRSQNPSAIQFCRVWSTWPPSMRNYDKAQLPQCCAAAAAEGVAAAARGAWRKSRTTILT